MKREKSQAVIMKQEDMEALMARIDHLCEKLPNVDDINYFQAMERLLRNYRRIEGILADEEAYMEISIPQRSKSIVRMQSGGERGGLEEAEAELERRKREEYRKTSLEFDRLKRVVERFEDKKEFEVIRLCYFGDGGRACKIEEAAREMGVNEKTVSRWRNNMINDMAVCLFGQKAALQASTYRDRGLDNKAQNVRNVPETVP